MRYRPLLLLAATSAALAGCVQDTNTSTNAPVNTPGNAAKPAGPPPFTAKKSAGDHLKIAVVPKGTTHQFWQTVHAGAEAAGKELNSEILWNGPKAETDIQDQIEIIRNYANQGVDGIAMAATDKSALASVVDEIQGKGIPVVIIDSGVEPDHSYSFIATDNVAAASKAADELGKELGEKGDVAVLPFLKGAGTSDERERGFLDGIKKYPNIKVVANEETKSDSSQAADKTETILTANPNLAGIFAASEPNVVGSAGVLKRKKLMGKVKLVGFDTSDAEMQLMKDGAVQALVAQDPFKMGYEGVKAIAQLVRGQGTPQRRIDTGATLVTPQNLNEPAIQKLLNPLAK